ncbi:MAG: SsrA-binding protein SmpB [Myxococcota bacterium]
MLETVEAGLVLVGPEVKSLREARANLGDAYGVIRNGECWLEKLHISPYEPATRDNPEAQRSRKLLLHRKQIRKLRVRVVERGLTLVPLRLYFKNGHAKVELALVRGKRLHDKRETLKRKDADREAARAMRDHRKGNRS